MAFFEVLGFVFFFNRPHKHVIIQIRQALTRIFFAQMLFVSCNWRLIISQTAREAILKNNLGCSPRQRSGLSGKVSGKRNCQQFKNLLQHDVQILQMLYYDTALKWCSNLQPRFASLLLRRPRRDFPHFMSPDLPAITGPCTVSKHSLGFQRG